uniref:Uncharacterized protein n=1 Tax=Daphnia galeata TaxID=27404 RepID=A0A8J2RAN1_9CRUS|nr:unnamed protein product [Daphnia galeata]
MYLFASCYCRPFSGWCSTQVVSTLSLGNNQLKWWQTIVRRVAASAFDDRVVTNVATGSTFCRACNIRVIPSALFDENSVISTVPGGVKRKSTRIFVISPVSRRGGGREEAVEVPSVQQRKDDGGVCPGIAGRPDSLLLSDVRNGPNKKVNFREKEKQILDKILGPTHYDRRIRPSAVNGTDGPTIVDINLMFRGISDISDNKMYTTVRGFRSFGQWKQVQCQS